MLATLFKFKGGVKPASHKDESTQTPIARAPLPPLLVVPLRQSAGGTPQPLVKPGQKVLKGERVGAPEENFSSAIHAPTSGTVRAIEPRMLPGMKLFSSALTTIAIEEPLAPRDVCLISRRSAPLTGVSQELTSMLISYSRLVHRSR